MSAVKTVYLVVYNLLCCMGWAWVLQNCIVSILTDSTPTLYASIEGWLKVVQTAAVLEIVHAATGLVRSPVFSTFLQGILYSI